MKTLYCVEFWIDGELFDVIGMYDRRKVCAYAGILAKRYFQDYGSVEIRGASRPDLA